MKSSTEKEAYLYTESQRFNQPAIWVLLGTLHLVFLYAVVQQVIMGIPFGTNPASNLGLCLIALFLLALSLLIGILRLDIEISKDTIRYRFYPLHPSFRTIEWASVKNAFLRTYKPIREYGGWGVRVGFFGYGKALNVRGNQGLQIIFTDNKKLLLGTQHPEQLQRALEQVYQRREKN